MTKKSKSIKLTFLNVVTIIAALSACGPTYASHGVDPCNTQTFQPQACQYAIAHHGYDYQGIWYPFIYPYGYDYYYGGYNSFILGGGRVYAAPYAMYDPVYVSYDARALRFSSNYSRSTGTYFSGRSSIGRTISRGGFGSIGRGFSSGA